MDLYVATNGSGWSNNTGWKDYSSGSDPCDDGWAGVTCSGIAGATDRNTYVAIMLQLVTPGGRLSRLRLCMVALSLIISAS